MEEQSNTNVAAISPKDEKLAAQNNMSQPARHTRMSIIPLHTVSDMEEIRMEEEIARIRRNSRALSALETEGKPASKVVSIVSSLEESNEDEVDELRPNPDREYLAILKEQNAFIEAQLNTVHRVPVSKSLNMYA